ncbi:MAG TPA: Hsp70 family protein [Syntrophomonadaceae bacterium]|nr:Hsp70 family protein [Syntrophomonadaceae bacterium]
MLRFNALFGNVDVKKLGKSNIRVMGIDLGTTNSVIAQINWDLAELDNLSAQCLEIDQFTYAGNYTSVLVPSMLALHNGKEIIGEGAKRLGAKGKKAGLEEGKNLFSETKNDMGIKRTYIRAPKGFQSSSEIAGKILRFLYEGAVEESSEPMDRIVVTVPASFQLSQREDMLTSGKLAGLDIYSGNLLDEPVAAFLDYLITYIDEGIFQDKASKNILVFDFGGGTCDIAIFVVKLPENATTVSLSLRQVSRYYRLGGGDIDRTIVHNVLIKQLEEQNDLDSFELGFEDKKKFIEPCLINAAEALKIKISNEISRRISFGQYDNADKEEIKTVLPGTYKCLLKDRTLLLNAPSLTAAQFEKLLEPFIDQDLLYPRESEYFMTCSIFAPLTDALDRCNMESSDIDYCLLVGGSSLISQVQQVVGDFFTNATIWNYPSIEATQSTVARGAVYYAFAKEVFGKGLVELTCHDTIYIRTKEGVQVLVPKGVALPYPGDGSWTQLDTLSIPKTTNQGLFYIRLEIIAGDEQRQLCTRIWPIEAPVKKGQPILLEYRFDENQTLNMKVSMPEIDQQRYDFNIEKPLTNVVNPQPTRQKIYEIEEELKTGGLGREEMLNKMVDLADKYADLDQYDKALDFLKKVLLNRGEDYSLLNKMGIYSGERGDYSAQKKYYLEAARVSSWDGAFFNLALSQKQRKEYEEALESINAALDREYRMPSLVLKAQIIKQLNCDEEAFSLLEEAMEEGKTVELLSDWELGWFMAGAKMSGDHEKYNAARKEKDCRKLTTKTEEGEGGFLPDENRK